MSFRIPIRDFADATLRLVLAFGVNIGLVYGEIIPEPNLRPEQMLGNWEAMAEVSSTLNAIYRMEIAKTGDSYLTEVREYPDAFQIYFISRLTKMEVKDGKVNLTFTALGGGRRPYHSIRIEGSALAKKTTPRYLGRSPGLVAIILKLRM